jgi:hypothetical protein
MTTFQVRLEAPNQHLQHYSPPDLGDVPLVIRCEDTQAGPLFERGILFGNAYLNPVLEPVASDPVAPIYLRDEYRSKLKAAIFAAWATRRNAKLAPDLLSGQMTFAQFARATKITDEDVAEYLPWLPAHLRPGTPSTNSHDPVDALDFDPADLPRDEFVAWPIVERGYYGLVGAPGGVGKSTYLLQLAISIAAGRQRWGNIEIRETCPVLVINMDDTPDKQRKRLVAVMANMGITRTDVGGRLHLWVPRHSKLLGEGDEPAPFYKELDENLRRIRPGLVILDPLVRFHLLDENQNTAMNQVAEAFIGLLRKHNCAGLIAHHPPKGHFVADDDMFRGATSLVTNARSTLFLLPGSAKGTVTAVHGKHSYTSEMAPASFRFEEHELPNGDKTAALVPLAIGDPLAWEGRDELLELVSAGRPEGGQWSANKRAKREYRLDVAVDERWGAGTAEQVLPAMEAAGLLKREMVKPGRTLYEAWSIVVASA